MLAPPSTVRPKHVFQIPASMAEATGVQSVGLVELTAIEEMQATKKAGTDTMRIAFELARELTVYERHEDQCRNAERQQDDAERRLQRPPAQLGQHKTQRAHGISSCAARRGMSASERP